MENEIQKNLFIQFIKFKLLIVEMLELKGDRSFFRTDITQGSDLTLLFQYCVS